MSGTLLILLGLWGALIPFIGPYFDYAFGSGGAWSFDMDKLWLSVLPGAATFVGGLLLAPTANRLGGGLGAWLGIVGGVWFVVGPTLSLMWGAGGAAAPLGSPRGQTSRIVVEQIGYFYGLGAVVLGLSAFALGRLTVRSVRDLPRVDADDRADLS